MIYSFYDSNVRIITQGEQMFPMKNERSKLVSVFINKVKEKDPSDLWDKCLADDLRIRMFREDNNSYCVGFCYDHLNQAWAFSAKELRLMADVLDEISKGEQK